MFQGFSTPNYVQVPHEYFDIILEKDMDKSANNRGVSKSSIKVLTFMIRYTFGWQKAGFSLKFTFRDIMDQTNMQKQQVNDGIKQCLERDWIERKEVDGEFYYRLKLKDNDVPWELDFDWKARAPRKEERYENHTSTHRYENHTESGYENHTDSDMKIIPDELAAALDTYGVVGALKKKDKDSIKENRESKREDKLESLPNQSETVQSVEELEYEYEALNEMKKIIFGEARKVDVESIWNHWKNRFPELQLTHMYAVMQATRDSARIKDDLTAVVITRLKSANIALIPRKQIALDFVADLKARIRG